MCPPSDFPASPVGGNGGSPPLTAIRESNHSLRFLLRSTSQGSDDDDDCQQKPKASLTFIQVEDCNPPPMAFADDLFHNGILIPLPSPALKLPPRLHPAGSEGTSPRSSHLQALSPKPPRKVSGLKQWKDFDPFVAAVETIRKDDSAVMKPFYWRPLERSFEQSVSRVLEEDERRAYESKLALGFARRSGRQKWNPLTTCFGSA